MPFVKGQSGNPRGRARGTKPNSGLAEIKAQMRQACPTAAAKLLYLAENADKDETKLRAILAILEWAWGKPGAQEPEQQRTNGAEILRLLSRPVESVHLEHEQPSATTEAPSYEASGAGHGEAEAI